MQTTAGERAVPYREVVGWLGTTTLLLLVLAPGPAAPARAGPPPRPRLPPPPALRTDIDGARLERRGDGSLRKVDAEARFEGIVHPDGRVEVRDLPDARVEFTTGRASVDWVLGFIRAIERP